MRFIPTRVHAMADYAMGVLLVAAPWLFGFAAGDVETWLPVVMGFGVIGYSLFTDYEVSMAKVISMPAHLMLDAGGGLFLAISPWLFGFAEYVWAPHVILGIIEIGTAMTTKIEPTHARHPHYGA